MFISSTKHLPSIIQGPPAQQCTQAWSHQLISLTAGHKDPLLDTNSLPEHQAQTGCSDPTATRQSTAPGDLCQPRSKMATPTEGQADTRRLSDGFCSDTHPSALDLPQTTCRSPSLGQVLSDTLSPRPRFPVTSYRPNLCTYKCGPLTPVEAQVRVNHR